MLSLLCSPSETHAEFDLRSHSLCHTLTHLAKDHTISAKTLQHKFCTTFIPDIVASLKVTLFLF